MPGYVHGTGSFVTTRPVDGPVFAHIGAVSVVSVDEKEVCPENRVRGSVLAEGSGGDKGDKEV